MRSALLTSMALALVASAGPADAQVMAHGFYNDVESRISVYFPGVTDAGQVTVEQVPALLTRDGNALGRPPATHIAPRHSYAAPDGTRYMVTSIDFRDAFDAHDPDLQAAMGTATTEYRQKGEVLADFATDVDRIPAHRLDIRLPDGDMLYALFVLHMDDVLEERRLVIAEAVTPPDAPAPEQFLSSLGIVNPQYFGTDADPTMWRIRYTPAGPPIHGQELVATQPWGIGEFEEVMSVGGEAVPGN